MTDKDCKEINAVQAAFPEAVHLLCHFHVFNAVDRRLTVANLCQRRKNIVYKAFEKAVYAESEIIIAEAEEFLCSLGNQLKLNMKNLS